LPQEAARSAAPGGSTPVRAPARTRRARSWHLPTSGRWVSSPPRGHAGSPAAQVQVDAPTLPLRCPTAARRASARRGIAPTPKPSRRCAMPCSAGSALMNRVPITAAVTASMGGGTRLPHRTPARSPDKTPAPAARLAGARPRRGLLGAEQRDRHRDGIGMSQRGCVRRGRGGKNSSASSITRRGEVWPRVSGRAASGTSAVRAALEGWRVGPGPGRRGSIGRTAGRPGRFITSRARGGTLRPGQAPHKRRRRHARAGRSPEPAQTPAKRHPSRPPPETPAPRGTSSETIMRRSAWPVYSPGAQRRHEHATGRWPWAMRWSGIRGRTQSTYQVPSPGQASRIAARRLPFVTRRRYTCTRRVASCRLTWSNWTRALG
jgi:hypothetical protein